MSKKECLEEDLVYGKFVFFFYRDEFVIYGSYILFLFVDERCFFKYVFCDDELLRCKFVSLLNEWGFLKYDRDFYGDDFWGLCFDVLIIEFGV